MSTWRIVRIIVASEQSSSRCSQQSAQVPDSPCHLIITGLQTADLESKLLTIAGVGANAMGLYQTGSAPRELALGCTV